MYFCEIASNEQIKDKTIPIHSSVFIADKDMLKIGKSLIVKYMPGIKHAIELTMAKDVPGASTVFLEFGNNAKEKLFTESPVINVKQIIVNPVSVEYEIIPWHKSYKEE